jgi:thiosulfate/3-mercaptopyruvate sulfurtransferase
LKKIFKTGFMLIIILMLVSTTLIGCTKEDDEKENSNKQDVNESKQTSQIDDSYICDAEWLKGNLDKVVILDARGEKAYKKGHIPGAINVTWQGFSNMTGVPGDAGWGTVLDAEELSKKLSAIGVTKDKDVVVYCDTNGWGEDGRILWMLRMAGVENSVLLDGGWNYWEANGYEVSKEAITPASSDFEVSQLDMSTTIDTDALSKDLNKFKVIDTRNKDEYDGAMKFGEARGGHIPGSINIPFQTLLNEDGRLKSGDELEGIFKEAGIEKDDEIVTYCTAGIRSAHMQVIFKMMGYDKARNYDESFYRWAADENLELATK